MKKSGFGYGVATGPDGIVERDTFTCGHACGGVVHLKPLMRPDDQGVMCKVCMRLVCGKCTPHGQCIPIEKWLEAQENPRAHMRLYGR